MGEVEKPPPGKVRSFLINVWIVLLLILAGAGLGAYGASRALEATRLADVEPALRIPLGIAGIGVGGMVGLGVALVLRFLPDMVRQRNARLGQVPVVRGCSISSRWCRSWDCRCAARPLSAW
ncbi:hypothetical protein ABZ863_22115 [Saccharomonospora sp. NPDC046836]|uniref:hypothetical protein n=1 Tax=Saccharomonospora sp. NPDC046836 TaxID=3156921 RepID=UPI0033DC5B68